MCDDFAAAVGTRGSHTHTEVTQILLLPLSLLLLCLILLLYYHPTICVRAPPWAVRVARVVLFCLRLIFRPLRLFASGILFLFRKCGCCHPDIVDSHGRTTAYFQCLLNENKARAAIAIFRALISSPPDSLLQKGAAAAFMEASKCAPSGGRAGSNPRPRAIQQPPQQAAGQDWRPSLMFWPLRFADATFSQDGAQQLAAVVYSLMFFPGALDASRALIALDDSIINPPFYGASVWERLLLLVHGQSSPPDRASPRVLCGRIDYPGDIVFTALLQELKLPNGAFPPFDLLWRALVTGPQHANGRPACMAAPMNLSHIDVTITHPPAPAGGGACAAVAPVLQRFVFPAGLSSLPLLFTSSRYPGHVGASLARHLAQHGAPLTIFSAINPPGWAAAASACAVCGALSLLV